MGHTVVLLYPVPEVGWHVPRELLRRIHWSHHSISDVLRNYPVTTSSQVYKQRTQVAWDLLDSIQGDRVYRLKPSEFFCDSFIKGRCITHTDKVSYYIDDDHLSRHGAEQVLIMFEELLEREGLASEGL